jgi:hypothetical protein
MTNPDDARVEWVAEAIDAWADIETDALGLGYQITNLNAVARAAIAAAEPRWQPVETAPKDGRRFLVSDGAAVATVWWSAEADEWIGHDTEGAFGAVTHWMPLPPPPGGDNE